MDRSVYCSAYILDRGSFVISGLPQETNHRKGSYVVVLELKG